MKVLLVVLDPGAVVPWFPLGLAYLAAVLRKAGHQVTIYTQEQEHYPEAHLTRYLDQNHFDVVGVGTIAGWHHYRKLLKVSEAINASQQRPFYVLGGHGPSPEPAFFLNKTGADAVVIGEGEETIVELLEVLGDPARLATVRGLAWRNGDHMVQNPSRPVIAEVDSIPFPAYDLFPMDYYRTLLMRRGTGDLGMSILSGRGCPFRCNFCYRMNAGFRPRRSEAILEEIRYLQSHHGIRFFGFDDELLMSSVQRTTELCEAFLRSGLNFRWSCMGRLNYAEPQLLQLMKRAGCVLISYGVESVDDVVLKKMGKALTNDMIINGVEYTLLAGIHPGLNIIFGNLGDTRATLNQDVEFLLKYQDGSVAIPIKPVTPYPGSPLYDYAIEQGLLHDAEDFYEHKHVSDYRLTVNFTNMSEEEVHRALYEANARLLRHHFETRMERALQEAARLYLGPAAERPAD